MISRRESLGALAGLLAAPAAVQAAPFKAPTCHAYTPTPDLVVDVHCHVMNSRDVDAQAFITGRMLRWKEKPWNPFARALAGGSLTGVTTVAKWNSMTPANENRILHRLLPQWLGRPDSACVNDAYGLYQSDAYEYTDGPRDGNPRIPHGALYNTRFSNAVRYMQEFPAVDLFIPSMVDFYEGTPPDIVTLSHIYERVALGTFGRMLPMVCFNPRRESDNRSARAKGSKDQTAFELVQQAVLQRGFAGVKLHPSVGFNPVANETAGCPQNGRVPYGRRTDDILYEFFRWCATHHVPVLTHGSPGIPAYKTCMQTGPADGWTNSPVYWGRLLDKLAADGLPPLKVCFGHFAGVFSADDKPFLGWIEQLASLMTRHTGLYTDVSIQSQLFEKVSTGVINKKNMEALLKYLDRHPVLAERSLYGTDWNMPDATLLAGKYLSTFDKSLPAATRAKVLGLNAVEFLGLRKGSPNRDRIDAYAARMVAAKRRPADHTPGWMAKVDKLPAK